MNASVKIFILTATTISVIVAAIFGLNYINKNYIQPGVSSAPNDAQTSYFDLNKLKSTSDKDESLNILLLGISGEGYKSGELTDSIILANLNFETKKINLISIPRDLWITNRQGEKQKINELYKLEGGTEKPSLNSAEQLKESLKEIVGQDIQKIAIIDLSGIKNLVDLLGGVQTEEGYMDGDQALFYVRDRSRPGSDFDRMLRQQKLITAIINKVTKNEGEILNDQATILQLFNLLEKNFASDIPFLEMSTFGTALKGTNMDNIGLHTITTNNLLQEEYRDVNGQNIYILYPKAGEGNYSEIHDFIKEIIG